MARRKSARQVRRQRKIRTFMFLLFLAALAGFAFLGKKILFDTGGRSQLMCAYQYPESVLTMDPSKVENESPTLFAEDLAAVTFDLDSDASVTSRAGITVGVDDKTVKFSYYGLQTMYPASVTKTVTLLTALKYGDLESTITIEDYMLSNLDPDSSVAGLKSGDTLTLEQLLYGLMLPSGNDAANGIAYLVAGGEEEFVALMNQTMTEIGATGSHFVNAHGLNDPNHYTTAYDIYLVYHELIKYDTFYEIVEAPEYRTFYTNNGQTVENYWVRGIKYFNGQVNPPAGVTPIGGKTGTTPEAGYCLSLLSKDDEGKEYVSVVFGASSRDGLYSSMTALLSKIPN